MKFNISAEDAKFIVDEQKQIVVCIIEHTKYLFSDFALNNFHISIDCDADYIIKRNQKWNNDLKRKLEMPDKFVGMAVCSKDDVWDEQIGRAIAFSRAKDNLLKSFFKHAQTYISTIDKWLEEAAEIINAMGDKLFENTERRHAYIESLIGTSEDGNKGNT